MISICNCLPSMSSVLRCIVSGTLTFALVVSLVPFGPQAVAHAEEAVSFASSATTAADAVDNEFIVTYAGEALAIDEPIGYAMTEEGADTLGGLGVTEQAEVVPSESNDDAGAVAVVQIADDADAEAVAQQIEALPNVVSVQPNYAYSLMDVAVNDPYFAAEGDSVSGVGQYYLLNSKIIEAWQHAKSEGLVTVAVLDSGCNLAHEDLQGILDTENAYDVTTGRPLAQGDVDNNGDAIGHGTMVAGVVGAQADNGVGIAGASYNAKVLPIKVFDESGRCTTADLIAAYDYLSGLISSGSATNLKVINMSLGYYADSLEEADSALQKAIASMRDDHGVLTVCAAGNGLDSARGTDKLCLPSDFDECLSVTALNKAGAEATFSNYNDAKDLSAYGESILSTNSDGSYSVATGTSMAAPQVAGVAAMLWAADGGLSVADVFSILQSSSCPIEEKKSGTAGALNASAAVAAILGLDQADDEQDLMPPESSGAATDDGAAAPQVELRENSWRYEDGERLIGKMDGSGDGEITLFAGEQCVWTKRGNTWYSSEGGKSMYVDNAYAFGIDVSYHNGRIDWSAVKRAGVDFAIIRCGWGDDYYSQDDTQFVNNVRGCLDNGIPFGVYIYSYAKRAYGSESADSEANHVLRCLREAGLSPASLTYPVYYDLEENSMASTANRTLLGDMAQVFCNKISSAGYTPGVYANLNWFNNYLTDSRFNNWSRWIAQYAAASNGRFETSYKGKYDIWQCMSNGKVSGIGGNVDINFDYKGFDRTVRDSKGLRLLNIDGTYASNTWYTNGRGQTFYFGADTYAVKWANEIDGKQYYFNDNGTMHKGWLTWSHDGSRTYYGADGAALSGWQTIGGNRYYFEIENYCRAARWARVIDGKCYYFNDNGTMRTGWLTWGHDGSRTYYGADGAALSGWQTIGGKTYYFDESNHCRSVRWQQTIDGKRYYFNDDGSMYRGWLVWNIDGSRSYFGSDGAALERWQTVGGKRYYFNPDNYYRGERWLRVIDGRVYYFNDDCSQYTGWLTWNHDGSRSYFDASDNGAALSGWQTIGGKTYYFNESNYCRGLRWQQTIDSKRYYFNDDCSMYKGWLTWNHDGSRSYFGSDGAALERWQTVGGKRYYFNPDNYYRGERWLRVIDGRVYYFNDDCSQYTGWLTWNHDGSRSYFDASDNGAALSGWQTVDGVLYYFDPNNYCRTQ